MSLLLLNADLKNLILRKNPLQAFWLDASNKDYLQDIIGVVTIC